MISYFSSLNLHNFKVFFYQKSVPPGSVRLENSRNVKNHYILIKEQSMYAFNVDNVS